MVKDNRNIKKTLKRTEAVNISNRPDVYGPINVRIKKIHFNNSKSLRRYEIETKILQILQDQQKFIRKNLLNAKNDTDFENAAKKIIKGLPAAENPLKGSDFSIREAALKVMVAATLSNLHSDAKDCAKLCNRTKVLSKDWMLALRIRTSQLENLFEK